MPALPPSLLAQLAALTPRELARLPPTERQEIAAALDAHERASESLLEYIPRVSPQLVRPDHLAPVANLFERARRGERVRACVSVPAQHGKTLLIEHGIAWWLDELPLDRLAYATYSQDQADSKSAETRDIATAAGIALSLDRNNLGEWRTRKGGGALFTGIGGKLTGNPAVGIVIDDPYKNRVEAESIACRRDVLGWFKSVVMTRFQEGGAILVVHTRWVEDDLIGALEKGECGQFEVVNLPFLANDQGEADDHGTVVLNPLRRMANGKVFGWTVAGAQQQLRDIGPYDAASIYQGKPRARGGTVFHEATRYDGRPDLSGARILLVEDPAGSDDPRANHSVTGAFALRGHGAEMTMDMVGLLRFQLRPEDAAPRLQRFQLRFGEKLHIEGSRDGKEQARCLKIVAPDLDVETFAPIGDKFLRSQGAAGAWNAAPSRIRVPARAEDIDATPEDLANFIRVVTKFTGMGDAEDDDADVLSHAWNIAVETDTGDPQPPPPVIDPSRWADSPGRGFG